MSQLRDFGTDSHRTISKNSSGCRLQIGYKKCFVSLCPIGEQFLLSSFREFVHITYTLLRIKQWNISPKHYAYQTLQTKKTNFEKLFWKTTIIIRFNLLHVCPSMPLLSEICCVFIPYLSVSKLYFMFYSLWWRLSLFRATAPVSQCSFKFSAPWQKAQSLMKLPSFPPG